MQLMRVEKLKKKARGKHGNATHKLIFEAIETSTFNLYVKVVARVKKAGVKRVEVVEGDPWILDYYGVGETGELRKAGLGRGHIFAKP